MEEKRKLTFGEWFENIWYHYKWMIIFIGVLVIFLVISLFQFLAADDPDVNILHVGPMYLSGTAVENIEETLNGMSEDYNGDGEFMVTILDITVNKLGTAEDTAVNYDQNNSALQRFQTEIRAGDAVIYALDKEYFDICISESLLTPLDEVIDDADMPENTVKDENGTAYGVYISDLDAYGLSGLSSFPDGAILCLRRSPEKDTIKYGRTQEVWEGNRRTFVNIIKYRDETAVDYDADILYSGFEDISEETREAIKSAVGAFSADRNGDGIRIDMLSFSFERDGSRLAETQANSDAMQAFETELYTGSSMIYLLDKEMFDICVSEGLLAPVSDLFDEENMPQGIVNGYGIYFSDLGVKDLDGFADVSADTVLCLRRSPENETIRYGRTLSAWEGNRDTFIGIVKYARESSEESQDVQETP